MPATTTNLFLLQDLEDPGRTGQLAQSDLQALQAVAGWIKTFVVKPHKDLGRAGTVCPFVPGSLERKVLWLASEQIAGRGEPDVVELMSGYMRLFLQTQPTGGDDADYKVIVVVFTDLPADRAQGVFDGVLGHLAVRSYADDGILFGPYYEGSEQTAIHNPGFRPFRSPVPFLFVRPGVIGDWEFFVDNDEWLALWARRYGESAVQALAETLRRTNWRQLGCDAALGPLPPTQLRTASRGRKLKMSVNQDVDQRLRGARAGLWRLAGPWWLMLITGIAWLIISVVVLRFRLTSITTVGVLIGVVFLAAMVNEFLLASVHVGWRWAHVLLGILFLVGAIWAFANPINAFWALASVIGLLFVLYGALDIISSVAAREISGTWWLGLVAGILLILLGFWASQQMFPARAALLLWVGFFALFRGISEIVIAFELRSRQHA